MPGSNEQHENNPEGWAKLLNQLQDCKDDVLVPSMQGLLKTLTEGLQRAAGTEKEQFTVQNWGELRKQFPVKGTPLELTSLPIGSAESGYFKSLDAAVQKYLYIDSQLDSMKHMDDYWWMQYVASTNTTPPYTTAKLTDYVNTNTVAQIQYILAIHHPGLVPHAVTRYKGLVQQKDVVSKKEEAKQQIAAEMQDMVKAAVALEVEKMNKRVLKEQNERAAKAKAHAESQGKKGDSSKPKESATQANEELLKNNKKNAQRATEMAMKRQAMARMNFDANYVTFIPSWQDSENHKDLLRSGDVERNPGPALIEASNDEEPA